MAYNNTEFIKIKAILLHYKISNGTINNAQLNIGISLRFVWMSLGSDNRGSYG